MNIFQKLKTLIIYIIRMGLQKELYVRVMLKVSEKKDSITIGKANTQ